MPGYIEDRWMSKRPAKEDDPAKGRVKGEKYELERHGQGKRYRVCGIPGVKDESFARLVDAKNWLATAQTDSRRGTFIDPELGQMLLGKYIDTVYLPGAGSNVNTSASVKNSIENHIKPNLGHLPMATIDEDHLRIWVATEQKTCMDSSVRLFWDHLSSILNTAVPKRIPRNPCKTRGIKPKAIERKARAFTKVQAGGMRLALRDRDSIAFELGLGAALRQGEAFGFSPDDVDRESEELHVRRQLLVDPSGKLYFKLPKGDKERDVPLSDVLADDIEAYVKEFDPLTVTLPWRGPGQPPGSTVTVKLLISTKHRNGVNEVRWNRDSWKPALERAGIISQLPSDEGEAEAATGGRRWEPSREYGFHILRHTYASVQLQAGESIVALSHWLGHDDPAFTLRRYTHFMPEDGKRGRSAMDAWLSR